MNFSIASNPLKQYEVQGFADFTPGSATKGKGDGLAVVSIIVAAFVFLAVIIVLAVHYGPQLRTVQITLRHEPMPQDLDNGVHLTEWKKLDSQRKCPAQSTLPLERNSNAAGPNIWSSSQEPNVIEVTYL
ncbi:small integral membrane protein 33 [Varanus komodoensis]|uniref:Small integral membrane protein 33 n=1 Tax=Varanus komodoensis TaxID=61221 RepID=A0A8D2L8P7_VARKO|nr:small integral membrane protein 33 [Varanus komodoensis]